MKLKEFSLLIISLILVSFLLELIIRNSYPQNIDGWYSTRDESGLNILKKIPHFIIV